MALRSLRIEGGTFIWDDGQVGILLRSTKGEVGEDVRRRAYAIQKRMKRLAPVWTGKLRDGIHVESLRETPDGPASRIRSDAPHTLVNELGRGPVHASGMRGTISTARGHGGKLSLQSASRSGVIASRSKGSLSGRGGRGKMNLAIPLRPGAMPPFGKGWGYYVTQVGPAKGSRFMENSVDAAVD